MGAFDDIFKIAGGALTGFLAGGPVGAVTGGLIGAGAIGETGATGGVASLGSAGANIIAGQAGGLEANIAASKALAIAQAGGVPTGFMKNITRTTVMTIAPNGTVVRTVTLKGSPYLMNSDFVILKRTLALINKAEERVPRPRTRGVKAKVEAAHTKGMLEAVIAAGNPTQALLTHHINNGE